MSVSMHQVSVHPLFLGECSGCMQLTVLLSLTLYCMENYSRDLRCFEMHRHTDWVVLLIFLYIKHMYMPFLQPVTILGIIIALDPKIATFTLPI